MTGKGRELIRQYCVRTYNGNYGLGMICESIEEVIYRFCKEKGIPLLHGLNYLSLITH